jgi:hypothetical protein
VRHSQVADLGKLGSGEGDQDGGSKRDVEDIANLDVEVNGNTGHDLEDLTNGKSAGVGLDKGRGVVEEVDPDGNVSTSLKAGNVQVGLDTDLGAETEANGEVDLGGEVDTGTEGDGQSLGKEALKVGLADRLGQEVNLDEGSLREGDVDTSLQVDSSRDADLKIETESSTELNVEQTRDGNVKSGRSKELDGLLDSSAGLEVELKGNLDTSEVDPHCGSKQERIADLNRDGTGDLSMGKLKAEVDGSLDAWELWGADTDAMLVTLSKLFTL